MLQCHVMVHLWPTDGRSEFVFTMMTGKSSLQPLGTPARASVTSFRHVLVFRKMSVRAQSNYKSRTEQRSGPCMSSSQLGWNMSKKACQYFPWCLLPVLCSVETARRIFYFFVYKITGHPFVIQYWTKPSCVVLQELLLCRSDVKPNQCPNPKNH